MDADMNRMFQLVLERLDKIDQESVKTNSRLDRIEQDVSGLKEDVSGLKQDVSGLNQDVSGLKQDVSGLKQEAAKTNSRLDKLEQEVTKLNIRQENEIIPQIKLLAEGQSVLPQMAKDIEKIKDKQEGMEIKLDALSEVVPQHSESIRELKKKAL